jgi:hypothetical protein
MWALSPLFRPLTVLLDSYVEKISASVREQTWREWFDSLSHQVDAAKAIVATLVGAATVVFGWFGISLTRRKTKAATKSTRSRKPKA